MFKIRSLTVAVKSLRMHRMLELDDNLRFSQLISATVRLKLTVYKFKCQKSKTLWFILINLDIE